jgi:arsenate reductase
MTAERRVLFLCTGNSCRSQMAEGWARHLWPGILEPSSAGTAPHGLDHRAVAAMAECGVDISGHRSTDISELSGERFDLVVTVCDHARETCPILPGRSPLLHAGFADPPRLAAAADGEEEALDHYRRVRDEIRKFVETLPGILGTGRPGSQD